MKSDLSNVKVGDKIWTIQEGWTEVERIANNNSNLFPIYTKRGECYGLGGSYRLEDKHPSAFLENPFEKGITREVEEEIIKSFIEYYNKQSDELFHVELGIIMYYLDYKYKPLPTKEEFLKSVNLTEEQVKQIMEFRNIASKT